MSRDKNNEKEKKIVFYVANAKQCLTLKIL